MREGYIVFKGVMRTVGAFAVAVGVVASIGVASPAGAASGDKNDINPKPVSALKKGGTFVPVVVDLCPQFNTSQPAGNLLNCSQVMDTLLPHAYYFDSSATHQWDKNWVLGAKFTKVNGKPTVTYDLNPMAIWSNGRKFGLKDFVATWTAKNGTNTAYENTSKVGFEDVESVKKGANDDQVVVTYKKTFADWRSLYGAIYPAELAATPEFWNKGWLTGPTVTSGPFEFVTIDKVARVTTVKRNPKWWGDGPVLDRIVFKALPQVAQIDALLNGEIDYMDVGNDPSGAARARGSDKLRVNVATAPLHEHLTFGSGSTPPTQDVRVRQALMLSLDRRLIAKTIQGPIMGDAAIENNNHVFLSGVACNQDNTGDLGKQNLPEAIKRLEAAGYTTVGSDGIRSKGSQRLTMNLIYPSGNVNRQNTVLLVAAQAKAVGIEVVPTIIPSGSYFVAPNVTSWPNNKYDVALFAWSGTNFPISSVSNLHKLGSPQNHGQIGSAQVNALYDRANNIFDAKKRCDLANQADKLQYQAVHSITLFQRPNAAAMNKKVANFGAFGFTSVDWTKVGFTK
jgi:peptide/nickel transport system substrate-binding protein